MEGNPNSNINMPIVKYNGNPARNITMAGNQAPTFNMAANPNLIMQADNAPSNVKFKAAQIEMQLRQALDVISTLLSVEVEEYRKTRGTNEDEVGIIESNLNTALNTIKSAIAAVVLVKNRAAERAHDFGDNVTTPDLPTSKDWKGKAKAEQAFSLFSNDDQESIDLNQDDDSDEEQQLERAKSLFKKHYPGISLTPREIWIAYNKDTNNLDMTKDYVCDLVRHGFLETCDNSGGQGPPNKALQIAMNQMRNSAQYSNCRMTEAWINWTGSESSGANDNVVISVNYSLADRFENVRNGHVAPVHDPFADFQYNPIPDKETEILSAVLERSLEEYDEWKKSNAVA